jgi:tetratricopeptide (TPR) repeat protein
MSEPGRILVFHLRRGDDMNHDEHDDEDVTKEIEQRIASADLAVRADALRDMIQHLSLEDKPKSELLPYIEAAIELNEQLNRPSDLAHVYWQLSDVYYSTSEFDESLDALYKSIDCARKSFNDSTLPMTTGNVANIMLKRRDFEAAVDWYRQSLKFAEEQGKRIFAAKTWMFLVSSYMCMDDYKEAHTCAQAAYEIFSAESNQFGMVDSLHQLAWAQLFGRFSATLSLEDVLAKSEALLELITHPFGDEMHVFLKALYELDFGFYNPGTLEAIDGGLESTRGRSDAQAAASFSFLRAKYLAKVGRHFEAIGILKNLLLISDEINPRIHRPEIHELLLETEIAAGRLADAASTALRAANEAAQALNPDAENLYRAKAGELFLKAGEPAKALAELEAAYLACGGESIVDDYPVSSKLARSYVLLGRHAEALTIANNLVMRLSDFAATANFGVDSSGAHYPREWDAELHEIKLDALTALGDAEHATAEAKICKEVYEKLEDFAAVARMHKAISSLNVESEGQPESQSQPAPSSFSSFDSQGQNLFGGQQ